MDKLQSAQLQVVLPGSRASFRRRIIDALRDLVPSPAGFCFVGKDDGRAFGDATRVVDGSARRMDAPDVALGATAGTRLSAAFGFDPKSVVAGVRRVYQSDELWPAKERKALPYFKQFSEPEGLTQALLLFVHEGGVLFGLAGVERRASDPDFTTRDLRALEDLAPFLVAGARAHQQYHELTREAAALRALGKVSGVVYVVDRDRKRVLFAADRQRGLDWDEDVAPIEEAIVESAEQWLAARARGDALPTPPRLPNGVVVAAVRIDGDPVFEGARCAAIRVKVKERAQVIEGLSKRERDVARLLVAGYSGVNVAAISGLSENTVRTYVRRLYTKLEANNRADLVRKLMEPEPPSTSPSSALTAPADSSLAQGDDTLD